MSPKICLNIATCCLTIFHLSSFCLTPHTDKVHALCFVFIGATDVLKTPPVLGKDGLLCT